METSAIYTLLNLAILLFTAWFSMRRTKFQNVVDDSTAAKNYRDLVINLQAEVKESQAKIDDLEDRLNHAHLDIELSVQVGEAPIIKNWKWVKREDTVPLVTP